MELVNPAPLETWITEHDPGLGLRVSNRSLATCWAQHPQAVHEITGLYLAWTPLDAAFPQPENSFSFCCVSKKSFSVLFPTLKYCEFLLSRHQVTLVPQRVRASPVIDERHVLLVPLISRGAYLYPLQSICVISKNFVPEPPKSCISNWALLSGGR